MTLRARASHLVLATLYALVFWRCYLTFLHPHFGYVGYDLFERPALFLVASLLVAIVPIVAFRGVRAVSSAISVFVYLVLYVPIIITFALGSSKPLEEILTVQVTFMAGMFVLFLADVVIIRSPLKLDLRFDLMPVVLGITVLSTLYMLLIYREGLRFSSFGDELYEQRFANEALGTGLLTRYLGAWLTTVFMPICVAFGLRRRRLRYTLAGVAAAVALYVGAANKLHILLPFVAIGFYRLQRGRLDAMMPIVAMGLAVAIIILSGMTPGTTAFFASGILLNRTIGNGGQLTMAYYDFFSFHERTWLSHVHGLRLFTQPYPYGSAEVGQVIGQFYWSPFMNANANFWATDGIAGLGLWGVLLISVLTAMLFVVVNAVTRRHDLFFTVLCFLPFVTTLLNQSLFSSVWSGGAFFLMIFFVLSPRVAPAPMRVKPEGAPRLGRMVSA
jgi:hypothetical protein